MEEMVSLYEAYVEEFRRLEQKRKPLEGAFGFGGGPQSYPCHETFAQDLERLLNQFAARTPAPGQVGAVLEYVYFTAPARWRSETAVYWMLQAVQGLTLELIPLLDRECAETLCQTYQGTYPRHQRLPVQAQVFAALRKKCGNGLARGWRHG